MAQRFSNTGVPKKWDKLMSWLSLSLNVTGGTSIGDGCQCNSGRAAGDCSDWVKLPVGLDWVTQKATIAAINTDRSTSNVVCRVLAQ